MKDFNLKNEKLDIIILSGQSNAEGNGVCSPKEQYFNERVFELTDDSVAVYGYGEIAYEKQTVFTADYAKYRKSDHRVAADFSETFAEEYIKSGLLASDRKILIVKAAVGGTGFSLKQWGVENPLHGRLCDMTDYALSLNKENRLVAFLWHQGEHDAFEQPNLSPSEREKFYYDNFTATVEDVRTRYGVKDLPVICGEFADSWADKFKPATDAVEKASEKACKDLKNAAMASSKGLLSNMQVMKWSGDDIHFCYDSVVEFGKRYFEKFKEVIGR